MSCLFVLFAHFSGGLLVLFLLLISKGSFFVKEINPYQLCVINIISKPVACFYSKFKFLKNLNVIKFVISFH